MTTNHIPYKDREEEDDKEEEERDKEDDKDEEERDEDEKDDKKGVVKGCLLSFCNSKTPWNYS